MCQRGALKSARGINAGLATLHAAVPTTRRYRPGAVPARRCATSRCGRAVTSTTAVMQLNALSRSRSPSSAAARRDSRRRRRAAELGASHVLLEAERHPADTIYKYQKGKLVMAEPSILPLRRPFSFAAGKRESILGAGTSELAKYKVNIRHGAQVTGIAGQKGAFDADRRGRHERSRPEAVVLAIGLQGNLRKLGVPGEDLDVRALPARRSRRVRGRDHRGRRRRRRRDRERDRARRAEPRDHGQPRARSSRAARRATSRSCSPRSRKASSSAATARPRAVERRRGRHARRASSMRRRPPGSEPIECDRVIARLGATPPRKLVEALRRASSRTTTRPRCRELSVDLRVERAGPLHRRRARRLPADQAGDEPGLRGGRDDHSDARSSPPTRTCCSPSSRASRAVGVRGARPHPQRRAAAGGHHDAAAARVHARQRRAHAGRGRGRVRAQRLHATRSSSIVERRRRGRARDRARDRRSRDARDRAFDAGEFFGELGLISGRRRAATVRRRQGLRADRDAAALDAEAHRLGRIGAPDDRPGVPRPRDPRATCRSRCPTPTSRSCCEGTQLKRYARARCCSRRATRSDGLYLIRAAARSTVSRRSAGATSCCLTSPPATTWARWRLLYDAPRTGDGAGGGRDRGPDHRRRARSRTCSSATRPARRRSRPRSSSAWRQACDGGAARSRAASSSYLVQRRRRRSDGHAADRREPVHPLQQLREGVRRHARRHVAPRPRGRADLRADPRARPRAATASIRTA